MNRPLRLLALALALIFAFAPAMAADETIIVIGDQQVLRIRADSGGFTARQRANALRQRLIDIYQAIGRSNKALTPDEITLDLTPGRPSIRVRGMLLLSVTQDDARVNGNSTVDDLARVWHERLRAALVKAAPLPGNTQYKEPNSDESPAPSGSPSP